jgi:uncharacterized protein YggE
MRLLFVLLLAAFAFPAFAEAPAFDRGPVITMNGYGKSEAPPDYAALVADVVTTAPTLDAASKAHRARATRAAELLKGLAAKGLEIKSSTFRLNNVTPSPVAGKPAPAPEFRAVTSFALQTRKIEAVDDVVTAVAASGLFELRDVSFALDERSKAVDAARRDAVFDARARATSYADAAGAELGEVLEISDSERPAPFLRAAPMAAAAEQKMQVTPPETLAANASVTITWRLKEKR